MKNTLLNLSRRQRQIMDILFREGECSAEDVRAQLPEPPSNSAVRALLATMVKKDYIHQKEKNFRYVYSAAMPQDKAQKTAIDRLINTFFGGSKADAVNALLGSDAGDISEEELKKIADMIAKAKQKGL